MIECRCGKAHIKVDETNERTVAGIKGLISAYNVSIKNSEAICLSCGTVLKKDE